jgi:nucleotide-binding universal stress UspA family protein
MRVLVAYDGTDGAQAALTVASRIGEASGGELVLCWVLDRRLDAVDVIAPSTEDAMAEVERRTRETVSELLAERNLTAEVRIEEVRRGEDVAERLATVAGDAGVELIVVASRRAAGLRGLLGSVARELLGVSPVPVVVVRPGDH